MNILKDLVIVLTLFYLDLKLVIHGQKDWDWEDSIDRHHCHGDFTFLLLVYNIHVFKG